MSDVAELFGGYSLDGPGRGRRTQLRADGRLLTRRLFTRPTIGDRHWPAA
jgi:hypothetical protein